MTDDYFGVIVGLELANSHKECLQMQVMDHIWNSAGITQLTVNIPLCLLVCEMANSQWK